MSADPRPLPRRLVLTALWLWVIAGGLAILGCVALAVSLLSFAVWDRHVPAPVAAAADTRKSYNVSGIDYVRGTSLMKMEVVASDEAYGSGSFSSKRCCGDTRNIVLLDRTTGETRRLLPDNDHRIAETKLLPEDDHFPVRYYYLLVERPGGDRYDVVFGDIGGTRHATVLSNVDGVDSLAVDAKGRAEMVVRENRKLAYRVIDLTSFQQIASHPIGID